MFVSVKNLTAFIDQNIQYVEDAINYHEVDENTYKNYL